jgi:hypothetical protein
MFKLARARPLASAVRAARVSYFILCVLPAAIPSASYAAMRTRE